jgi:hypothetical protein
VTCGARIVYRTHVLHNGTLCGCQAAVEPVREASLEANAASVAREWIDPSASWRHVGSRPQHLPSRLLPTRPSGAGEAPLGGSIGIQGPHAGESAGPRCSPDRRLASGLSHRHSTPTRAPKHCAQCPHQARQPRLHVLDSSSRCFDAGRFRSWSPLTYYLHQSSDRNCMPPSSITSGAFRT